MKLGTLWRDLNLQCVGTLKEVYSDGRMRIEFDDGFTYNYYREEIEEVFKCNCGKISEHVETISTMPGNIDTKFVTVRFCNDCYSELHRYDDIQYPEENVENDVQQSEPLRTLWNSTRNLYDRFELDAPLSDRVRKFNEEVEEFLVEVNKRDNFEDNRAHLAEEAGDVIVTLIGILQKLDVDIDDLYDQLEMVAQKNDAKDHKTHVVHEGLIMRRSKLNGQ